MRRKQKFLFRSGILSLMFMGPSSIGFADILPPNNLHLEDALNGASGITEQQFNDILDEVENLYRAQFFFFNAELQVDRFWSDSTVNAYAKRSGKRWIIEMYGGLARRPEVTPDGFALVTCHEIGHHLGGYPFKGDIWAASEGQADYYAAQGCARWLWKSKTEENRHFAKTVSAPAKLKCDTSWQTVDDRHLCYRISMAGLSLARLLGRHDNTAPDFNRQDTSRVNRTNIHHPAAQCRLDTYVAAANCTVFPNLDLIPGAKATLGRDSIYAEMEAARESCMQASSWLETPGYNGQHRPACWFKDQLVSGDPALN